MTTIYKVIDAFNDLAAQIGCEVSQLGWWSMGQQGKSTGDVHFHGFNNQQFDFNGIPDHFYCLLSDYYIQINAHFSNWNKTGATVMKEIGVKIGSQKCGFVYLQMDRDGFCKMNNVEFSGKAYFPTGVSNFIGDVKFSTEFAGYDPFPGIEHAGTFQNACLEINAGYYNLKLVRSSEPVSHEDACPYFVNLVADLRNSEVAKRYMPHGILGQTVNKDCIAPEGSDEDYKVSSLFADDFKFNRFKPN